MTTKVWSTIGIMFFSALAGCFIGMCLEWSTHKYQVLEPKLRKNLFTIRPDGTLDHVYAYEYTNQEHWEKVGKLGDLLILKKRKN